MKKHLKNKVINKLLIIQTAFIGDVILTTPLINAIKEVYPLTQIDVITVPQCKEILQNNPSINQIIPFAKKSKSLLAFLKFIYYISKQKYNVSVSPHSSFRSGLIPFLAGIRIRIGFKRNLQKVLLTHSVPHPTEGHKISKNLKLLELLPNARTIMLNNKIFNFSEQTTIYPNEENYNKIQVLLNSLPLYKKLILLAPGSVWFTKRWPLNNYYLLAEKLLNDDFVIILSGSPAEKDICDSILWNVANKFPEKRDFVKTTAGEFNLLDSSALIEKVDLVICNDSGTLHIANAFQKTVFAFFGPTVKRFGYYPYQKNDQVFEVDLECRPCGKHGNIKCPENHHDCMNLIKVETVYSKVSQYFATQNETDKFSLPPDKKA